MFQDALAQLRAGRKTGHWMWFVFPQLDGLGSSPTARRYAISGLPEARAYLADSVLGPRLQECCEALLALDPSVGAAEVLGDIDALKLRSCVTLFDRASTRSQTVFARVLDRFYDGMPDQTTLRLLESGG